VDLVAEAAARRQARAARREARAQREAAEAARVAYETSDEGRYDRLLAVDPAMARRLRPSDSRKVRRALQHCESTGRLASSIFLSGRAEASSERDERPSSAPAAAGARRGGDRRDAKWGAGGSAARRAEAAEAVEAAAEAVEAAAEAARSPREDPRTRKTARPADGPRSQQAQEEAQRVPRRRREPSGAEEEEEDAMAFAARFALPFDARSPRWVDCAGFRAAPDGNGAGEDVGFGAPGGLLALEALAAWLASDRERALAVLTRVVRNGQVALDDACVAAANVAAETLRLSAIRIPDSPEIRDSDSAEIRDSDSADRDSADSPGPVLWDLEDSPADALATTRVWALADGAATVDEAGRHGCRLFHEVWALAFRMIEARVNSVSYERGARGTTSAPVASSIEKTPPPALNPRLWTSVFAIDRGPFALPVVSPCALTADFFFYIQQSPSTTFPTRC
jgi:hypothetical protein